MEPLTIILLFAGLALLLRLAADQLDRQRVAAYVQERGGRIVSIGWAPFGRGWFGEKNARIYEVVYYDRAGDLHMATCKTSLFAGVYWTEDRVAHRKARWEERFDELDGPERAMIHYIDDPTPAADPPVELERLRQENERLRRELEAVRGSVP